MNMAQGVALLTEDKEKFLSSLTETGNIALSCKHAGISRTVVYDLMDADEEWREQVQSARRRGLERLVEEAGTIGLEEIPGRKFYPAIAILHVRAQHPAYRDIAKTVLQQTGLTAEQHALYRAELKKELLGDSEQDKGKSEKK
jgi:hypothetical protein